MLIAKDVEMLKAYFSSVVNSDDLTIPRRLE